MGEDASEERRLFERRGVPSVAYVASELGIVRVDFAPDRIGEFSLVERCPATGVAASAAVVAVATADAVLLNRGEGFEATGFGGAVAVGTDGGTVVAASPDGEIGRLDAGTEAGWETAGTVPSPQRFDGRLLAAGDGVYRVGGSGADDGSGAADGISRVGEGPAGDGAGGVRDVAAAGPYAATPAGLFRLDGGAWQCESDGEAAVIASDGERAHAVSGGRVFEREAEPAPEGGRWERLSLPDAGTVVDLAYGASLLAVTADGEFLLAPAADQATDGQAGWRSRTLGLRGAVGVAVVG